VLLVQRIRDRGSERVDHLIGARNVRRRSPVEDSADDPATDQARALLGCPLQTADDARGPLHRAFIDREVRNVDILGKRSGWRD
jgi:hypothetical protein